MTKFFKSKNKSKPEVMKEVVPRSMEEIQKEHADVGFQAGKAQYIIHVYKKELNRLNGILEALNYESNKREALDKAATATKDAGDKTGVA